MQAGARRRAAKSRIKGVVAIAGIFSNWGSISLSVSHFGVSEPFRWGCAASVARFASSAAVELLTL
jgi:hypothetical protein